MFSTSEKTSHAKPSVHQQNGGPAFFRKAGEQSFFSNKETSSFFGSRIQTKLSVSSPDDPQEKEADTVADKVMRMSEPTMLTQHKEEEKLQRAEDKKEEIQAKEEASFSGTQSNNIELGTLQKSEDKKEEKIHAKCEACDQEEKKVHAKLFTKPVINTSENINRKNISLFHSDIIQSSGRGPPAGSISFEHSLSSSKGKGSALPDNTKQFMESRFNADFSSVRIHTDSNAERMSTSINAQAFAHSNDIYFNAGKYSPNTASGGALLAHELTHTIQQGKSQQKNNILTPEQTKAQPDTLNENSSTKAPQPVSINQPKTEQTNNSATKKSTSKNANKIAGEANEADSKNTDTGKNKKTKLTILMPEPPAELNANSKKRLQQSQHKATQSAAIHSSLPPSNKNVEDARATVEEPTEESNAKAGDDLVAALGEKPKPSPEITALCNKIREVIRSKRPPDEDSLVNAEPEGAAKDAGGQLNDTINSDVDKAGKNYDDMKQTPTGTADKEPEKLTTPSDNVDAPNIDAQNAVPDAVPSADTSLDADVASSEQQINNAGMTTEPAKLVQDGPIADARNANAELKDTAANDPAAVQAAQKLQLAEAGKDMAALQAKALQALTSSRTTTIKGVGGDQVNMKESEEEKRKRVGDDAQKIFNEAQTTVNGLLSPLSADAMKKWNADVDVASKNFKATLNKVKKWIDDRHSGVGGFFVSIGDWATGLPDWVTEEYDKAETKFGDDICESITAISTNVNTVIATCEQLIKKAHADIVDLFKKSFGDLDGWANDQIKTFEKQLDGLQKKVTQTRDQLNKDLAGRASKSVQDVREQISVLRQKAKGMIGRIADAIAAFIDDPAKFIIEGLLNLLGIPIPAFWRLVNKIKTVIGQIADDPIGFAGNLMKALSKGFSQFTDNFGKHLLEGLIAWLTSGLGSVGVQLPADFSLPSIITFILQLMGISWERIRKLLAKHIGEENVALIEKAYFLVTGFIEKGPTGIFEMIKEQLDPKNLLDKILDAVVKFVEGELIKRVAIELLKLFNPVGAILKAIEAIYDIFKWVFDNAAKIFTLIETVVNGIGDIISGNIGGMASAIEKALTLLIAPIIDFFAELVGLDGLPQKIADLIKSFQDWIEGILDRVIGWLADKAKALLQKGKDAISNWWNTKKQLKTKDGEAHTIYFEGKEGNASLMIASTPVTVRAYLIKIKDDNKFKDSDIEKPLLTTEKIEIKEKETATNDEQQTHKANDISNLMTELASNLAELPLESAGVNSGILYGGTYKGSFGTSVTIGFQQAPFAPGSEPNIDNDIYSKINVRKDGGGSYYVKGHLLNDNLGGTGTQWSNLTPLNRDANKNHQLQFEDKIKEAVNGTKARGINTASLSKQGYTKGFSVTTTYGRSEPAALTYLKDDSKDDLPSGADPGWSINELKDLLEGEKSVPTTINCNATIKNKNESAEERASYTVSNDIDYGILDNYQLGLKPKQKVTLAQYINTSAKTQKEMTDSFNAIDGIGPVRAKNIYDAFKRKGRITNGKADIGVGLLALNNLNEKNNLIITSGELTWPPINIG